MIKVITNDEAAALKDDYATVEKFTDVRHVEVLLMPDSPVTLIHEGNRVIMVGQEEADFI